MWAQVGGWQGGWMDGVWQAPEVFATAGCRRLEPACCLTTSPLHVGAGAECDSPYDTRYKPERILLYDKHPGGIGLAAAVSWCCWLC